jgi:cephalosporin hydroxylase
VDPRETFQIEVEKNIRRMAEDRDLQALSRTWIKDSGPYGYTYNFSWMGIPIIQLPQDIVAMQELIWVTKPDLIIETGIAHGGSLIMSASMLLLLDYCDEVKTGRPWDLSKPRRQVLGVDIDIRAHNRAAIEAHPLANRIEMIQGSSVAPDVVSVVCERAKSYQRIFVCLDSDHTHDHVLAELKAYAPLVTRGSYCVVSDTLIEDRLPGSFPGRAWDKGNNPKTAVWEYLKTHPEFEIDKSIPAKLLITVAPDGYLRRTG